MCFEGDGSGELEVNWDLDGECDVHTAGRRWMEWGRRVKDCGLRRRPERAASSETMWLGLLRFKTHCDSSAARKRQRQMHKLHKQHKQTQQKQQKQQKQRNTTGAQGESARARREVHGGRQGGLVGKVSHGTAMVRTSVSKVAHVSCKSARSR